MRLPAPPRSASFRWFFVGRTVSLFGGAMAPVALALAVLDLTGSVSPTKGRGRNPVGRRTSTRR